LGEDDVHPNERPSKSTNGPEGRKETGEDI
jgi:hypothetical protein